MPGNFGIIGFITAAVGAALISVGALEQPRPCAEVSIDSSILADSRLPTPEVSTEELRRLLTDGSVTVLDTRPPLEYAISHIPGAANVAPKPGVPISVYVSDVAEIGRLMKGNKAAPLVLYCNGPFCGKSRRLSEELLAAGYTNVRLYQLGIPVWRALGGITQMEEEGTRHVFQKDATAVWIDARDTEEFRSGSLAGAHNIPRRDVLHGKDVGEVRKAKDDGRLPMHDHNTRIVVFGKDGEQAREVAAAIAREAFHNVSFYAGTLVGLKAAVEKSR